MTVPDFRSKDGIFKTTANGKQLFDASVYNHNASTEAFHEMIQNLVPLCETASHTPFHHMVATIAYEGRLRRLYTQNIDGLEVSLQPLATHIPLPEKEPWPVTIQLHGGLDKMECHKCHHVSKLDSSLFKGPEPPLCEVCEETDSTRAANGQRRHGVGRLRPRITLYNEPSQDADAIGSVCQADVDDPPDAVIVVGTSLAIPDIQRLVTRLCHAARAKGDGATAWLNLEHEHPSTKHLWDFVIRGTSDKLAALLDLPRWECSNRDCTTTSAFPGRMLKKMRPPENNNYNSSLTDAGFTSKHTLPAGTIEVAQGDGTTLLEALPHAEETPASPSKWMMMPTQMAFHNSVRRRGHLSERQRKTSMERGKRIVRNKRNQYSQQSQTEQVVRHAKTGEDCHQEQIEQLPQDLVRIAGRHKLSRSLNEAQHETTLQHILAFRPDLKSVPGYSIPQHATQEDPLSRPQNPLQIGSEGCDYYWIAMNNVIGMEVPEPVDHLAVQAFCRNTATNIDQLISGKEANLVSLRDALARECAQDYRDRCLLEIHNINADMKDALESVGTIESFTQSQRNLEEILERRQKVFDSYIAAQITKTIHQQAAVEQILRLSDTLQTMDQGLNAELEEANHVLGKVRQYSKGFEVLGVEQELKRFMERGHAASESLKIKQKQRARFLKAVEAALNTVPDHLRTEMGYLEQQRRGTR